MQIEHYEWYSEKLQRNMHITRYGHWGPPMIVFPTSHGGWKQFEDYGMPWDCEHLIEAGRIQFFSIDDFNADSWYASHLHPADRIHNHNVYEKYVVEEVVPFVYHYSGNERIGVMGASFGAFHTVNILLKHPDIFKTAFSFSGEFQMNQFLGGYYDDNLYFNNPVDYLPNLNDQHQLYLLDQTCDICLMTGEHDFSWDGTRVLHDILNSKGVGHIYQVWDAPCSHNEYWWKKQLPFLISNLY